MARPKIEVFVDQDALRALAETNQALVDLAASPDTVVSFAMQSQQRQLVQDFIEQSRQVLGLTTEPSKGLVRR